MEKDRKLFKNLKIFVPENHSECIGYASEQLQFYLQKIIGYCFKIETINLTNKNPYFLFFCADSFVESPPDIDKSAIIDDGFIIEGSESGLAIVANTQRGVLYGVYDYLERFYQVRFLTNDFEYVPVKNKVIIPDNKILSNPDFLMRGYFIGNTYDDLSKCGKDDYSFIAKNRTKDIFMKIPPKFGGDHKVFGRNYVHNFSFFVPFSKYGNEHPEWYRFFYALEKTTSTLDITNGITSDGKLDKSMDISVAKVVISEMIKDAESHPDKEIFNFTQEDGDYFFESEKVNALAEKYKRSGILIRFCNVVEQEVNKYLKEKYNRSIKIITFAYSYAKEAPVKWVDGKCYPLDKTVIPNENVIIQLALFANGAYSYFSEKQDEKFKRIIKEWKVVSKNFWFWMYDINFHKYLYYYDTFDQIAQNIRGFLDYGISCLAVNGPLEEGRHWQCNIRAYAYRKLMWDSSLDPSKLMNEYIDLYYGVASEYVKEIIKKFRANANVCRKDKDYVLMTRGSCEKPCYTPESLLVEVLEIIQKGENAIKNAKINESQKNIYTEHLMGVKATPLLMMYDMYFDHKEHPDIKEYLEIKELFFETVKKAKIHMAGEHWTMEQFRKECDESDREKGRVLN